MSDSTSLRAASRSLLLATGFAIFGHGLLSTSAALRLAGASIGEGAAGLVLSAYFGGLAFGSFALAATIQRVGSVRAFTAFTAFAVVTTVLHDLVPPGIAWLFLRFASGIAMAGFFITVEGWLTASARPELRGRILSIYLVTLYLGLSTSQFLLPFLPRVGVDPILISALVGALAATIVSLTTTPEPTFDSPDPMPLRVALRQAPIGLTGAVVSGFVIGTIYTSYPLMLREAGRSESESAILLGASLLGGLLGQRPIGVLSDRGDRRVVLLGVATLLALLCALSPEPEQAGTATAVVHAVIFGALGFTLYPLSVAHALDRVPSERGLGLVAQLILASALGSTVGPIAASTLSASVGGQGFYVANGLCLVGLAVVSVSRIARVDPVEQESFRAIPRTSPIVGEMDPRIPEDSD